MDEQTKAVLVVGHNPGLQELAYMLAATDSPGPALQRLAAKFPTAGLAELEFDGNDWRALGPGRARLRAFTTPKSLS